MTRWVPRGRVSTQMANLSCDCSFGAFHGLILCKGELGQICGCVNSGPKVPAITGAVTPPLSGGFPLLCSDSRGQTDSCCRCYFLSLGTALMLQSQSPLREDGVSLSPGGSSRWDRVGLHFLKCGRLFRYPRRRPYLPYVT